LPASLKHGRFVTLASVSTRQLLADVVVRRIGLFAGLAFVFFLGSCADQGAPDHISAPAEAVLNSTYGQLQRRIFNVQCMVCHTSNTPAARQSGLLLEPTVSYQNLIGARPTNSVAQADGMVRVLPGSANSSLLFHKLNWSPEHHAARNYGSPMPLGGEPLTIGQLEFIRRWIAAGAPRTGFVVDSVLLHDTRKQYIDEFRPLPLPAAGFQLHLDSFAVAPNFERELFQYRTVGNTQDAYVNRIETRMRLNGHHFLLLTFRDSTPPHIIPRRNVIRDIRAADGQMQYENMLVMGWHQFFAGANTPYDDKRLPDGVALKLPADVSLDLNAHFINSALRPIVGEVSVNLHTVPANQVQHVARPFLRFDETFTLPPQQRTIVTRTFLFSQPLTILMLTSHNHELGERFEIRLAGGARNGELVYSSTDWKHPTILWLPQPIALQAGQGLTAVVTYNNTTNRSIGHGLLSTDEMLVLRGYAY
jgi:hypothetical protein